MDRKSLKLPFREGSPPDWMCPTCRKGFLRIRKDTFFKEELRSSRHHSYDEWEPEWIEYVYSCLLLCTNEQCKEIVSCSGVGSVEADYGEDEDGQPVQEYDDFFRPKYFEPPLHLLSLPDACPESIAIPMKESFRLFFSSPSAASNCVRSAVEELLTELKVRRFNLKDGKRRFIGLHARIALIPTKYGDLKELILAIKWLGNAGSHGTVGEGGISIDDVMDSYELMEHVLNEVYAPTKKKLAALAKKVNKKKGPAK